MALEYRPLAILDRWPDGDSPPADFDIPGGQKENGKEIGSVYVHSAFCNDRKVIAIFKIADDSEHLNCSHCHLGIYLNDFQPARSDYSAFVSTFSKGARFRIRNARQRSVRSANAVILASIRMHHAIDTVQVNGMLMILCGRFNSWPRFCSNEISLRCCCLRYRFHWQWSYRISRYIGLEILASAIVIDTHGSQIEFASESFASLFADWTTEKCLQIIRLHEPEHCFAGTGWTINGITRLRSSRRTTVRRKITSTTGNEIARSHRTITNYVNYMKSKETEKNESLRDANQCSETVDCVTRRWRASG